MSQNEIGFYDNFFIAQERDTDGDGMSDLFDPCPTNPENDADGDMICESIDNCPTVPNFEVFVLETGEQVYQLDSDEDGAGDACDVCALDPANDVDGDGVCGDLDNCPSAPNSAQLDNDGDTAGDACDLDDDADGIPDALEDCPLTPNPTQSDFDGDGLGDACDSDDDGDAVVDGNDACLGTAPGALHDASGCSIADLAPCTLPAGTAWKNHGAYVKAVTDVVRAFEAAGIISPSQRDHIVSQAAESACG